MIFLFAVLFDYIKLIYQKFHIELIYKVVHIGTNNWHPLKLRDCFEICGPVSRSAKLNGGASYEKVGEARVKRHGNCLTMHMVIWHAYPVLYLRFNYFI